MSAFVSRLRHGTRSCYVNMPCRCEECTEANAVYCRAGVYRRARELAADPSLAPHGSYQTYTNWGCRCEECIAVHAAACREYGARRRAAS